MPDDYTIGDLARSDLYPDETQMQPPSDDKFMGMTPGQIADLSSPGVAWQGGENMLIGAGRMAMAPGQALQSSPDNPITTEQLIKPAADIAMTTVGGSTPFAPKGALGVGGGKMGALAETNAPPFYSAVERAVQDAKQNAAPGQQWAGFLRNQPGVKPEEVEALGLGKLFEQPGAVPKQAVLGEIAANRVNVGTVMKGARPSSEGGEWIGPGQYRMEGGVEWSPTTKFSQYTLPGGENYREMLLTLPITNVEKAKFERMTALEQKLRNPADYDAPELNALRAEYKQLADETRNVGAFQSSHYDEPNILAHVRYNDRVIDGKKTLFVEEVQSDWHQKGKREGYQSDSTLTPDESSELRSLQQRYDLHNEGSGGNFSGDDLTRMSDLQSKLGKNTGVPDAPFKTTWPDLAMKRVIREAAEKGYDKVAWTPGSVQADRYDLSKQIDKISTYRLQNAGELELKDGQPQYRIEAFKNGSLAVDKYVTENELADHVGKELADKIIKQENGARSYSGLDLKVGGEGMKGFYDQILPAAVNKIVKKAGGRVGEGDINVTPPSSDAAGSGLQIRPAGGRYEVFDTNTGALEQRFDTLQEARDHLSGIREAERPRKVHTLDITPQLREMALKKGFPLFAAGGLVAGGAMGDLAKQDEYQ
jgi:hypothetical protein